MPEEVGPGPTILVVDDDRAICALIARRLESAGYTTIKADNGKTAVKILGQTPVDLVITDIVMPEADGIELVGVLRQKYPQVKVITISGPQNEAYLKLCQSLGAARSCCKPLDLAALTAAVDELTQTSR